MPIAPRALAAGIALLLLGHRGLAAGTNTDVNGFYFVSANGTGVEVRIDKGRTDWEATPPIHTEDWQTVRLGEKAVLDLKKWFSFDRAGTYEINCFYSLDILRSGSTLGLKNVLWTEHVSADFKVVVK